MSSFFCNQCSKHDILVGTPCHWGTLGGILGSHGNECPPCVLLVPQWPQLVLVWLAVAPLPCSCGFCATWLVANLRKSDSSSFGPPGYSWQSVKKWLRRGIASGPRPLLGFAWRVGTSGHMHWPLLAPCMPMGLATHMVWATSKQQVNCR